MGGDGMTGISLFRGKSYDELYDLFQNLTYTLSEDRQNLINREIWYLPTVRSRDYNLAIKPNNEIDMPPKNNVYLLFIIARDENCPYKDFAIGFRVKDLRKPGTGMMSSYNYLSPWPGDVHGPEIIKGWGLTTAVQTTGDRCKNILNSFYEVFTNMEDISTRFISSLNAWNKTIGNVIFKADAAFSNLSLNTPTPGEADADRTRQVKKEFRQKLEAMSPEEKAKHLKDAMDIVKQEALRRGKLDQQWLEN